MSDCPRKNKWFRSCKFEGRFDKIIQRPRDMGEMFWQSIPIGAKTPTDRITYVRDICVTCGKTVERMPSP